MTDKPTKFPPRWLKAMNKVIVWLQRRGVPLPMITLTVLGRKTGTPRSTPVTPFDVAGRRYIVAGHRGLDWVQNARSAGIGVLAQGRRKERVRLVDLPEDQRGAILREFPVKVPRGVSMFLKTGTVAGRSPEAFEAAAPHCAVFRIEPLD
ncbi:MAG: nitroreductase family deazaflavin-dependent oxidoreductase [Streptosporangiales bacterium]|nr:nitroreductase family deazaflavin-dependent oxidoreductase [Streptosporangiales bacterium]MBO0892031.1 nitroreductase family deazaflavin-dependent oxidoreductase [Acidothermales bacterium]